MISTTTQPNPDFARQMIESLLNAVDEARKNIIRIIWDNLLTFLSDYWLYVLGFLLIVFFINFSKAMFGRWGSLGSFLYNLLYFVILLVIGLIWGPEVFVSDYWSAIGTVFLYPVCYISVGWILRKIRAK